MGVGALCYLRSDSRPAVEAMDGGATGLARGAGPVFEGDKEREGEQRPRQRDERQVNSRRLGHAATPA